MATDDSLRDFGAQAPHGPNPTGEHVATANISDLGMNSNEEGVFQTILKPDDMYDNAGTYWADLPLLQRVRFILRTDRQETKREAGIVWGMFKKDPLSPVGAYFRNMVIPGMGLLLEG
jgi:hypothetical protein